MSEQVTLRIDKVVDGGQGLAFRDGKAVFVPYVLPGELVLAQIEDERARFSLASLVEVLEPSDGRVEPGCPLFGRCGGCQWLHVRYEAQMELKKAILQENLQRLGRLENVDVVVLPAELTEGYRTSLRLHVSPDGLTGYYQMGTHEVVPQPGCPLHAPAMDRVIAGGKEGLKGIECVILKMGDDGQTVANLTSTWFSRLPEKASAFPSDGLFFNHRHERGVQWVLRGVGGVTFRVSPHSFFQIHQGMAERLHQEVKRLACQSDLVTLVDLYSGTGAMSMGLTDRFNEVIGVELNKIAASDAVETARLNKIGNYRQIEARAEVGLDALRKRDVKPSAVILDPPRRGCEREVLAALCEMKPSELIYVSCNPATLSRDLSSLCSKGWKIWECLVLDLFPQTYHMESVVHLRPS